MLQGESYKILQQRYSLISIFRSCHGEFSLCLLTHTSLIGSYIYMCVCVCVCVYVCMYIHTYAHIYTYMCIYVYVIYICIYVCVYIHVYIHIWRERERERREWSPGLHSETLSQKLNKRRKEKKGKIKEHSVTETSCKVWIKGLFPQRP